MPKGVYMNITTVQQAKNLLSLPKSERNKKILRHFLENGIKSSEELRVLLVTGLGVKPQTHSMCSGHIAPFTVLWELFSGQVSEGVVWANRSGSKSFMMGGLLSWLWSCIYPFCSSRILGGSLSQSERAYLAHQYFWTESNSRDLIKGESKMSETKWRNGSDVAILAASQTQIRGPHPQKLFLDECEELDIKIFQASLSQPQQKMGVESSTIMMSTYHRTSGVMSYIMENLVGEGKYKLFHYCIYETLEACKDLSCSRCPLTNLGCPGPEKMKNANGYYTYRDLFKKIKGLDADTFDAEWRSLRPGVKGLVHPGFSEERNVTSKMDYNVNNNNIKVGVDWGFTNPSAWTFLQKQDGKIIQWDEIYVLNKTLPQIIEILKTKSYHSHIKSNAVFVYDPENPENAETLRVAGYKVQAGYNALEEGITVLNGLIKPIVGEPLFYVHSRCKNTRDEFKAYRRREYIVGGKNVVEEPISANDHTMSANRYGAMAFHREEFEKPIMVSVDSPSTKVTRLGWSRRI